MNMQQKLERVTREIQFISTHVDSDAAVLLAALDKVQAVVAAEREAVQARVAAEVKAALA